MPRTFCFLLLIALAACAPVSQSSIPSITQSPNRQIAKSAFFYLRMEAAPTLVLLEKPDSSAPLREIPLAVPSGCGFWALNPAPAGPHIAIEWECAFGSTVQLLDVDAGKASSPVTDAGVDNRFLAWEPDGEAVYLKVGTLSNPQIVRFTVADGRSTPLAISPNTYDLAVAPDKTILYAFTNGIGFGAEVWRRDQARQQRQLLNDTQNILGLFRYAPDGQQIAYIRLPDSQEAFPAAELWVMDGDGKNAHLAASADGGRGFPPVWSPEGDRIAFIGRQPGGNESPNLSIYTLSNAQLLTLEVSPLTPPVWTADGVYVTLSSGDKMELWLYELPGGNARKILSGACCAGWIH